MDKQLEMLSKANDHYVRVAGKIARYLGDGDGEDDSDSGGREANLDKVREMVRENIRLERDFRIRMQAMEQTREELSSIPDLDIQKEFERLRQILVKSNPAPPESLKDHEAYKRLEDSIRENSSVTVKNPQCGHTYEKAYIIHLIESSKGGRIRCPIMSCVNENLLRKEDLLPPTNLRRKVHQKKLGSSKN